MPRSPMMTPVGALLKMFALVSLLLVTLSACTGRTSSAAAGAVASSAAVKGGLAAPATPGAAHATPATQSGNPSTAGDAAAEDAGAEVVVYASDLPQNALYELEIWNDPASPEGKMISLPNNGDELDPPPENDPHATIPVQVRSGIPYRCWIHMKVGAPKGKSQANVIWVQFADAVDKDNQEILRPGTASYLTGQGPATEGWSWVGCDMKDKTDPLVYFGISGATTVRLQAGMEGVGFDQLVLSPARFLEDSPAQAVVEK